MKQIPKIQTMNFQVIIVYIKLEIIAKGVGSQYIKKVLNFKIKDDLSINCKDVESLCIELLFENKRNTLINVLYRPPNGQTESFEKNFKMFLV